MSQPADPGAPAWRRAFRDLESEHGFVQQQPQPGIRKHCLGDDSPSEHDAEGERELIDQRQHSDRRGLPRPPADMRGAARDALAPGDMRAPEPLRPYHS